jgi:hypothetical protein
MILVVSFWQTNFINAMNNRFNYWHLNLLIPVELRNKITLSLPTTR